MKILNSMAIIVLWFMVNATLGIYWGLGIVAGEWKLPHILFYSWLIISIGLLIVYLIRKWKY